MAFELYIPPCIDAPAHPFHLPPPEWPLRIQIEGPLVSIQKLLPEIPWPTPQVFPLPAGPELVRLAFQKIYGREVRPEVAGDVVVRDEYLGWVRERPLTRIDHLVPTDDPNLEMLQINIIEMNDDGGEYANMYLRFAVDPAEYTEEKILAVPRCRQIRKGTQDRGRVNGMVAVRDKRDRKILETRQVMLNPLPSYKAS